MMPSRFTWSCGLAAVALLLLAACGGGSSSSAGASAGKSRAPKAARPSREFVVTMTGKAETPPGAPKGVGVAVIAFHDSTHQICWRFAHMHGFAKPTYAHIHKGAAHQAGPIVLPLSTASGLHHRGCVVTSATLMTQIAKHPEGYYVNVHSAQYPSGAVRAQL